MKSNLTAMLITAFAISASPLYAQVIGVGTGATPSDKSSTATNVDTSVNTSRGVGPNPNTGLMIETPNADLKAKNRASLKAKSKIDTESNAGVHNHTAGH